METEKKITYTHSKLVVGEQAGHEVEEMIVVFVELYGEDGERGEERFDSWWELALLVPVFCEGAKGSIR